MGVADKVMGLMTKKFESLAQSYPDDPLVQLHLQRVRQGAGDDLIVMDDK